MAGANVKSGCACRHRRVECLPGKQITTAFNPITAQQINPTAGLIDIQVERGGGRLSTPFDAVADLKVTGARAPPADPCDPRTDTDHGARSRPVKQWFGLLPIAILKAERTLSF